MIKLIATDLDGTLFYPKSKLHGFPKSNTEFLRSFIDEGGLFVIVTGRNCRVYDRIKKKLNREVSIVGCNGSFIWDGKELEYSLPLDNKKAARIYTNFKSSYGILSWILFDREGTLYCSTNEVPRTIVNSVKLVNHLNGFYRERMIFDEELFIKHLENGTNYKLMGTFGLGKNAKRIASESVTALQDRSFDFSIAASNNSVELTTAGANKGKTLELFCKLHGIKKDEVCVCGDSGNDLPMFKCFPHTFAMSHAPAGFKAQANHEIDRISDLEKYVKDASLLEKDEIKVIDFQKGMETN